MFSWSKSVSSPQLYFLCISLLKYKLVFKIQTIMASVCPILICIDQDGDVSTNIIGDSILTISYVKGRKLALH